MLKYIVVSLSIMKSSVKLFRPQYANEIFDDTENGDSFFCNTSMALWLYGSTAPWLCANENTRHKGQCIFIPRKSVISHRDLFTYGEVKSDGRKETDGQT